MGPYAWPAHGYVAVCTDTCTCPRAPARTRLPMVAAPNVGLGVYVCVGAVACCDVIDGARASGSVVVH